MSKLGDAARELVLRALGPAADEFGAMIGNEVRTWKAARIQRLAELWRKKMADKAVPDEAVRQLPFGSVYRVLETASTEDADEVLDMWAGLLANAMDPNSEVEIERAFVDILTRIGAGEVLLLSAAELTIRHLRERTAENDKEMIAVARRLSSLSERSRRIAYENLRRLGCVLPANIWPSGGLAARTGARGRETAASAAGVASALDSAHRIQRLSSGALAFDPIEVFAGDPPRVLLRFQLTELGKNLVLACTLKPEEVNHG